MNNFISNVVSKGQKKFKRSYIFVPKNLTVKQLKIKMILFPNAIIKNKDISLSSDFFEQLKKEKDIKPILLEISKNEILSKNFLNHFSEFLPFTIFILEHFDVSQINLSFLSKYPSIFKKMFEKNKIHLVKKFLKHENYRNCTFLIFLLVAYNQVYLFRKVISKNHIIFFHLCSDIKKTQLSRFIKTYIKTFGFDQYASSLWGIVLDSENKNLIQLFQKHHIPFPNWNK